MHQLPILPKPFKLTADVGLIQELTAGERHEAKDR